MDGKDELKQQVADEQTATATEPTTGEGQAEVMPAETAGQPTDAATQDEGGEG